MIKHFLNLWSKLIAFVLANMESKSEVSTEIEEWMTLCRKEDALDGVVKIRKASGDTPTE